MCEYRNSFYIIFSLLTIRLRPCGTNHTKCSRNDGLDRKMTASTSWTISPCAHQLWTGCSADYSTSPQRPLRAFSKTSLPSWPSSDQFAMWQTWTAPRFPTLTIITPPNIRTKLRTNYLFLTIRRKQLTLFGQLYPEEDVPVLLEECVCFYGDYFLEFNLGSSQFLAFQIVGVDFLHDYLCTCTGVNLHLEAFVLIGLDERIPRDIQSFEWSEVPCAYQVVLVLNYVVGKVEFNQCWKITSHQSLSVDPSYPVSWDW